MGKMNKDDANKMAQAVDNRIVQIAKQVYRQVPNDREVEGFVTAFDERYNNYTVKINNKEYSAIPQERTLGPIDINTRVKVKIPNNQMSNAYICGIVDGSIKSNPYPLPLGMIIPSAIIQNDAGLHLLDGSELAIGGTYDAFCQFIINNISKVATCTAADYQTEMNTYGQCGKFVVTSTYVKLPTITKFIEGLSDISNLGTSFGAGLPNITGELRGSASQVVPPTGAETGALSTSQLTVNQYITLGGSSANRNGSILSFDASKSNPTYGNSNTVQPQSTKFPYYIVVGTVIVKKIDVNLNNIISDLNNIAGNLNTKANKDCGNLSSSDIKSWMDTLSFLPTTTDYLDVTSLCTTTRTSMTTFYTPDFDGWLVFKTSVANTTTNYQGGFQNSTLEIRIQTGLHNYASFAGGYIPFRSGDVLQYVKESNMTVNSVRLYKLKGEV